MRTIAVTTLALCALNASAASAQTTWCTPVGRTTMCNTTPPINDNSQYLQNNMSNFGAALGALIARKREKAATRAAAEQAQAQAEAQAKAHADMQANAQTQANLQTQIDAFERSRLENEVTVFGMEHPDFSVYRAAMATIFQSGRAQNLEDAYVLAKAAK